MKRTLRLRREDGPELPRSPWPFRGTRSAVHGSPDRAALYIVVKATGSPYPCPVVLYGVHEFSEDQLVFRALEGDAESFGWQEGESFPIDESYCKRVLDGRIPRVVPEAKREDATRDLRVTSEADIGSYAAVPLVLSDGRLYGTLCCPSHEPDPWLRERDLGLMERTARCLVEQLERHGGL